MKKKKQDIIVLRGKGSSIPKEIQKKLEPIIKKQMKETGSPIAIMFNPNDFKTPKEKEAIMWLMLANSLANKACIECGYEWNPNNPDFPPYDENGKPSWRKLYTSNKAISTDDPDKFICEECDRD